MKINSLLGIFYFLLIVANFAVYSFEELAEERQTMPSIPLIGRNEFYASKCYSRKKSRQTVVILGSPQNGSFVGRGEVGELKAKF